MTSEEIRLKEDRERTAYWKRWGPYLSERQWGTVREDYSATGEAWSYFPHDQARSRAYRWGEDGIAGICDSHQRLCFAIALWNEQDPILKERLFGLSGTEGNHGEDVKEYYFYLDNTPTHAYMKYLYKYPQAAFPYANLVNENHRRDHQSPEYELLDTGVFAHNRYYDVTVEYAKASPEDILIQISVTNRDQQPHRLHLLPTLWFRNSWSWDFDCPKPQLSLDLSQSQTARVKAAHPTLGDRWLACDGEPQLLFTDNETNFQRLFGTENLSAYVKDGIHDYVIHNCKNAVNPQQTGTKASAWYPCTIEAGETRLFKLRLRDSREQDSDLFGSEFTAIVQQRAAEADAFYQSLCPSQSQDLQNVQRQAWAGLLWNKQYYHYIVETWLEGDPAQPPPSPQRSRNRRWRHLYCDDVLSMPDKWEYPWFAAWDLAFHTVSLAVIDPDLAKYQLQRLTREWYMHPNGQLPAYEWAFGDVNPPIQAWAALKVYQLEQAHYGRSDRLFLERVFQKLLLNFTWWVNQEDEVGNNVFEGGFLGLDNISLFDRSQPLPTGGSLQQTDGTSWMAMYCLNMLEIALELSQKNQAYEDIASKFFEHFIYIAEALNNNSVCDSDLWDESDQFFYDSISLPDGSHLPLKVRSVVGLIPLFAVATIDQKTLDRLPDFRQRVSWFLDNRPELGQDIAFLEATGTDDIRLLSLVPVKKLRPILARMLDEAEFLSPYGIRSLSRYHADHPYELTLEGQTYRIDYEPAESTSGIFGGNSNWRGPIWFPVNYLLIESLKKFHRYFGRDFQIGCPTQTNAAMTLETVAQLISARLTQIFLQTPAGQRPVYGDTELFQADPNWQNYILFYEYFHGENGAGLGASHQTGWTGLIANLIQDG